MVRDKIESIPRKHEFCSGANNLWRTIKSLTNRKTQDNKAAISFEGTIIADKKKVANQFNRKFTSHPTTVSKDKRQLPRHLQKLPHSSMQFTEEEVNLAIHSTKNSKTT